jgi:hypothetical protein
MNRDAYELWISISGFESLGGSQIFRGLLSNPAQVPTAAARFS